MRVKGQKAVSSWLKVAPSTFRELHGFDARPAHEKRAILESWVAWLNQTGAQDEATLAFRQRLSQLLEAFDEDQKGFIDQAQLQHSLDTWLETADRVGGPEGDQDPTSQHPSLWHSHRTGEDH